MEKAVIILSIDDGRCDLYRLAKELLIPQKIPATLNITAGRVCADCGLAITAEQLFELSESHLFEFANHSYDHTNDEEDIKRGFLALCDLLDRDIDEPMGFASPHSKMSIEYIKENIVKLRRLGVKYVRTCREDYFNRKGDTVALTSYPVMFTTPVSEMKRMTDIAVEKGYCLIYLFHSVLKKGEEKYGDTWSYDYDDFAQWLSYVITQQEQGMLEIMTTADYIEGQLAQSGL